VARLRHFVGLSIDEVAYALGLSRATTFREWACARSWRSTALAPREMSDPETSRGGELHVSR
jgi:hypothetical protein